MKVVKALFPVLRTTKRFPSNAAIKNVRGVLKKEIQGRSYHTISRSEFGLNRSFGALSLQRDSFQGLVRVPFNQIQKRSLFIQTEETPNPASLKFLPGCTVLSSEFGQSMDFRKNESTHNSPLAMLLFRVNGVEGVFLGPDFITVSKTDSISWAQLKPDIFATIMDFFAAGKEAVTGEKTDNEARSSEADEDDDEVVSIIKMLLEEQVRPMVQEDGGDIFFKSFDEKTGVVQVKLAGSCAGCPSSTVTLKNGVENMLMYHVPEVTRVDEVLDEEELNERTLSFNPTD
mmetsp:Transcript_15028/g.17011  ORF Transcript_15028/g.17011 Transcript_15028/m.17011 type:complete len:287 (+) Transcript_15028:112-972(+)